MPDSILSLSWLIGDRISRVERNESGTWRLNFKSGATLFIECLWRKIEHGVIASTSEDHGQWFGLPAPINGVATLEEFFPYSVSSVSIRQGTADISLGFGDDATLEVISTSAGYEAWEAIHPSHGSVVACAGGQLHTFKRNQPV